MGGAMLGAVALYFSIQMPNMTPKGVADSDV